MTNFFQKAIVVTDLHWGKKNNDRQHNIDCEEFVNWSISRGLELGADTYICLGDWHDNRKSLNISTMNYSLSSLEKIAANFEKFVLILGNHDLLYKDKREINSVEFARNISNLILIKDPLVAGNCSFIPWLVSEDYENLPKFNSKYVFGHFELPHFLMNAMAEMPDVGKINIDVFDKTEYVFSGHFHKRQRKLNKSGTEIIYIGNAFPHNFSDAGDVDRGLMFLEWDKKPKFENWPNQPTYKNIAFSSLLENPKKYLKPKMSVRVALDTVLNFEEQNFIKECFLKHFELREFGIIQAKDDEGVETALDLEFQSIDQIVIEGLSSIDSKSIDPNILIEIYQNL